MRHAVPLFLFSAFLCLAQPVAALESLTFRIAGDNAALRKDLQAASLLQTAEREKQTSPRNLFGAALADYARLIEALYANGYYSGVIHILVDGREAADIPLLSIPTRINTITVSVDPGPPFRFGHVEITPLAPGTELPPDFRPDRPARSGAIRDAVSDAVNSWRDAGHAKAAPAGQSIVADHAAHRLSAAIRLDTGPPVTFGKLIVTGPSAVRTKRIRRIAGLRTGKIYSPADLARASERLRRTGAFSSVAFTEADKLGPDNSMDIRLALADEKPRRFGIGAEISSPDGMLLSGYWVHRNLFGGAERLRIDGEVANIGGATGGIDYTLGARLEFPATFGRDTTGFTVVKLEHLDEPSFRSDQASFGIGASRRFGDRLEAEAGVTYSYSETDDGLGKRTFSLLSFPTAATWDSRDNALDAANGYFANLQIAPFAGLNGSASGVRTFADARAYRGLGADDRIVLAGRFQFGSIVGPALTDTHPDLLFLSGGSNTVRGQPYRTLGVDLGGGTHLGGRSFVGLSGEIRASLSTNLGAVAFADAGYIGAESLFDGSGAWQSGAGLGLRYKTGLGPIRFDIATPVSGSTSTGMQFYLGIGQAF